MEKHETSRQEAGRVLAAIVVKMRSVAAKISADAALTSQSLQD